MRENRFDQIPSLCNPEQGKIMLEHGLDGFFLFSRMIDLGTLVVTKHREYRPISDANRVVDQLDLSLTRGFT